MDVSLLSYLNHNLGKKEERSGNSKCYEYCKNEFQHLHDFPARSYKETKKKIKMNESTGQRKKNLEIHDNFSAKLIL